jgi:hypothetical protein
MHSLAPEYLELNAAGVIDEPATLRAVALERGEIFSAFEEVRFVLYCAVAAITAGVGILVKENLDRIGPLTLIFVLALAAAACYATAVRTRLRHASRSIGGDYLLLLGALIIGADLGYAESQFHWLGSHWSWYLLILAVLHAITAYVFDSRLVLSVSLTSLAGWFGIDGHMAGLFQIDGVLRASGIEAMVCAAVMLLWRVVHQRMDGETPFIEVFEHFVANLGFGSALALCGNPDTRWMAVVVFIVLAAVSIRRGLSIREEIFVIYGVGYSTVGLCIVEAQIVRGTVIAAMLALATVIAALILLWQLHQGLKGRTS